MEENKTDEYLKSLGLKDVYKANDDSELNLKNILEDFTSDLQSELTESKDTVKNLRQLLQVKSEQTASLYNQNTLLITNIKTFKELCDIETPTVAELAIRIRCADILSDKQELIEDKNIKVLNKIRAIAFQYGISEIINLCNPLLPLSQAEQSKLEIEAEAEGLDKIKDKLEHLQKIYDIQKEINLFMLDFISDKDIETVKSKLRDLTKSDTPIVKEMTEGCNSQVCLISCQKLKDCRFPK